MEPENVSTSIIRPIKIVALGLKKRKSGQVCFGNINEPANHSLWLKPGDLRGGLVKLVSGQKIAHDVVFYYVRKTVDAKQ